MSHELRSRQIFSNHLYVLVMNLCDMIKQCYVHMEAAITASLEQSVDPTRFSLYQASSLARIESNLQKWHIWTVPHIPWIRSTYTILCARRWEFPCSRWQSTMSRALAFMGLASTILESGAISGVVLSVMKG